MIGEYIDRYGGTRKSGTAYRYYVCKSAKKKVCGKQLLTDSKIEKIALAVAAACEADYDSSATKAVIQEVDVAIAPPGKLWCMGKR